MKARVSTVFIVLLIAVFALNLTAGEKKVVDKSFKPAELVKIKVVSGDCVVKKGKSNEIKVHLVYTFPEDKYKPVFEREGNTLVLREEFSKEKNFNFKGSSSWTVTVPQGTDIEGKTASGDIKVTGVQAAVSAKTASGDIYLEDLKGNVEAKAASGDIKVIKAEGNVTVKVASGDIEVTDAAGAVDLNCASGEITAKGILLKGAANFSAVSGNLYVQLARTSDYDISIKTVSGDATLDYNGNTVKGYFTFKGQKGNIHSDIPFDDKDGGKHSPFVKKYIKKGDAPKVTLKTVSGKLTLKK